MFLRRFSTQTLVVCTLLASGCRDREITVYRAPKDPAPASRPAPPADATLPDGHPPIGQADASLPPGHPATGPAGPAGAMTGDVPTASGADLVWTAPAHWQPKTASAMRRGSYNVPGEAGAMADMSITAFPGETGGLFANVNRWRNQVGLPPIEEAQLDAAIERVDIGAFHIVLVDVLGSANGQPTRLIGAIVPHHGQTWYFKLLGPDALVAHEKPVLRDFLKTVKARES